MVKSEREKVLSELTSRIFDSMVDEIVMDSALSSHHEVARGRAVCHVCHNLCGLDHSSGSSNLMAPPMVSSRHPTPSAEGRALNGSSGTGTSTPTSVKAEGAFYFECLNCQRPIASNRYAPHLSSCMGIGTGTRRAANRSNVKTKLPSDAGRSESPYVASENGAASDDASPSPAKGKGKSKTKRVEDAEFNLKRKRPGSPQISPSNKQPKKQKTSGSPVSRVKADSDATIPSNTYHPSIGSQSKIPSKLRDSSIASFQPSRSSPSSRSSSPETPMASTSTPTSGLSAQSPPGKKKGRPLKPKSNGNVKALPPKRPSPPTPPPPKRVPDPDYLIDVEGEETGSSTDTDSS
ncbi:hypothetical protein PILCRDRAFT_818115 [Piloderma croceum F 1598]|uniref:SAGA-associated factor 11 n=1 Tax=Piloderma croceum (strain F 1598) TaxID=765440 RepID=A0A0C3FY04_PILCF|nr:hypothetical protein PILCRDRAFT_818115 [Piloderma croceum F 1598]